MCHTPRTHPTVYLSSSLQCSIKHISWRGQQNTQWLGSVGESLEIIVRFKNCTQTTKFYYDLHINFDCAFKFSYSKIFNFNYPAL